MQRALAVALFLIPACGGGDGPQNLCADDIVDPVDDDGCCTVGANANNDNDCVPECGNAIPESGESCDDGNTDSGDGCDNQCVLEVVPTAFLITEMNLSDPHAFAVGILDVTDTVDDLIRDSINMDATMPPDGFLDFSVVPVFRPLDQQSGAVVALDIVFADCTAPIEGTSCTRPTEPGEVVTATSTNDVCLTPIAGTTGNYSPAIILPSAPCFSTSAVTFDVTLGSIVLHLEDAKISATYSGDPATSLVNGLIAGFVTEAEADSTILPEDILVVGGEPLSAILKDEDKDDNDGVSGWWFYLNFTAQPVSYTD